MSALCCPRILVSCAVVVFAASSAFAQPAAEVFVGYSYLYAEPGEAMLEGGGTASLDNSNLHGAEISGAFFLNRNTAVEVAFGYNRGSISFDGVVAPGLDVPIGSADVDQYTFLVGPRFRVWSSPRQSFDVRALVGGSSLDYRVPVGVSAITGDEFGFAFAVGGSYTVMLNDFFSLRVIQPDVLIATAGPNTRTNFRFSTGLVILY